MEVLSSTSTDDRFKIWKRKVMELHRSLCDGCGSDDRVQAYMIVPPEAGGTFLDKDGNYIYSNGTTICRVCALAKRIVERHSPKEERQLVSVWISQPLYQQLVTGINQWGCASMGDMMRQLIHHYTVGFQDGIYEDLELYQDEDDNTVKLSIWVSPDKYTEFQGITKVSGVSVSQTLRSLIYLFIDTAGQRLKQGVVTLNER